MSVRDSRLAPFCYQSLAAVRTIHAEWKGQQRSTALSIYQALTYQANEARTREGFEASRRDLALLAGVSDRSLDKYGAAFERLGLLIIERDRAGDLNLPNRWTLIEPDQQGGEVISPLAKSIRHERPKVANSVRQGGEVISHDKKNAVEEVRQEENPPNPPEGGNDFPVLPSSNRQRERDRYDAECAALAGQLFPTGGGEAIRCVDQAIRAGKATDDAAVLTWAEQWFPALRGPAQP